jgi:hypothetical protein
VEPNTDIEMEENIRVNISLSPYDYRKLKNWSTLHGKSPTAFAGQIVASKIEANLDLIDKMVDDYAKLKGISREELEASWEKEPTE